jgi:AcrR family transcriptional regulator
MKKASAIPAADATAPKPRGRPRSFDREQALERAMDVFWSKGFEAASLTDLTEAMGINPPSLYAAFGDKEGLFMEAVQRYHTHSQEGCPYGDLPTAREAVESLLTFAATMFTEPGHPRGCMAVMAMMTSSTSSPKLQELLFEQRNFAKGKLRERIQRGVKEGDVPPDADVNALTNLYSAVLSGLSLQARDGATRKALLAAVQAAMQAWPSAHTKPARRKLRAVA